MATFAVPMGPSILPSSRRRNSVDRAAAERTPEQLFAAGYAACFEGAARLAAKDARVKLGPDTHVTTRVGIGPREEGGFGLAVAIDAHLDGVEKAQAEAIVKKVHENICPYSHATRGNVQVDVRVV